MSKKLPNKVAIVTGASKGIGASIAKHLAAEGASVVVNYSSSKEGADARRRAKSPKPAARPSPCRPTSPSRPTSIASSPKPRKPSASWTSSSTMPAFMSSRRSKTSPRSHFHKQFNLNVLGLLLTRKKR